MKIRFLRKWLIFRSNLIKLSEKGEKPVYFNKDNIVRFHDRGDKHLNIVTTVSSWSIRFEKQRLLNRSLRRLIRGLK